MPSSSFDTTACRRLAVLRRHVAPAEQSSWESSSDMHVDFEVCAGSSSKAAQPRRSSSFSIERMQQMFEPDFKEERQRVKEFLSDPLFTPRYDLNLDEHRALCLERVKRIAESGIVKLTDYKENPARFFTLLEYGVYVDNSMSTKIGVQYNLWGGSVLSLGTERHAHLIPAIENLELPGIFALTELGHGSNVRGIETTAVYDKKTDEFVINTPTETAQKFWLGNAAKHGKMATVFAQLTLNNEPKGVHAFIVPIRDDDGNICQGVRVADCGAKMGLNGVDNGRLWFDNVRVPRENLLNRYADVLSDGSYVSSIASADARFAAMIGELVGGRLAIAGGNVSMSKLGLLIAIRYACSRKQFGPEPGKEIYIMDYQTHKMRLIPMLAKTYAYFFAVRYARELYFSKSPETMKEVHVVCSGLKAIITWHKSECLQLCRECCGGMGFSALNRIGMMKTDSDVEQTYEGDNVVLLQQVAKSMLGDLRSRFKGKNKVAVLATALEEEIWPFLFDKNPVRRHIVKQDFLLDPSLYRRAFEYREYKLTTKLASQLQERSKKMNGFDAWNSCLSLALDAAQAYVERLTLSKFLEGIAKAHSGEKEVLRMLCSLYALNVIQDHMGWYLSHKYFAPGKADWVREQILDLVDSLRPMVLDLVDSFGIPESLVHAPIAGDWVKYYSWENTPESRGLDGERDLLPLPESVIAAGRH